ncbi:hypothetical protein INT45_012975 [Circinella minor]|uniref:Uncharacterized protein n=1 Tax=Circinella minor TaxID=1195481 RepID=A0A8H7RYU6_9FUNG|nr:hypothetical protein INT45_012975 [Circinella minor]
MNLVITAYHRLLNVLEAHIEAWNDNWPELSAAASKVGWVKLQGYYCKATGHVSIVMNPRLKYDWWESENWDEYRTEATKLVNKNMGQAQIAIRFSSANLCS